MLFLRRKPFQRTCHPVIGVRWVWRTAHHHGDLKRLGFLELSKLQHPHSTVDHRNACRRPKGWHPRQIARSSVAPALGMRQLDILHVCWMHACPLGYGQWAFSLQAVELVTPQWHRGGYLTSKLITKCHWWFADLLQHMTFHEPLFALISMLNSHDNFTSQ